MGRSTGGAIGLRAPSFITGGASDAGEEIRTTAGSGFIPTHNCVGNRPVGEPRDRFDGFPSYGPVPAGSINAPCHARLKQFARGNTGGGGRRWLFPWPG